MINNFPVLGMILHFGVDFLFVINLRDAVAVRLGLAKYNKKRKIIIS